MLPADGKAPQSWCFFLEAPLAAGWRAPDRGNEWLGGWDNKLGARGSEAWRKREKRWTGPDPGSS